MQAWVTNTGGQPAPAVPTTTNPGHDTQSQPPQRHVYLPQPTPPTSQPIETTQLTQNLSPRSRQAIINANSNRSLAVATARLPVPSTRTGHARDASLNISRATRPVASEPTQSSRKPAPFWEGSTVDGSLFSDTASNGDASAPVTSMYQVPFRGPTYQHRGETPHPRPFVKEEANIPDQHVPFIIGPDGMIGSVTGPLTRSASTPDARNHRRGLGGVTSSGLDLGQESEDSQSQASPDKTPSARRLPHPRPTTARPNNRRGSFSERTSHSQREDVTSKVQPQAPPQPRAYQAPRDDLDDVRSEHSIPLRLKTQRDDRPITLFADTDTPMVSNHEESEEELIEEPPPPPKPATKPKPPINRQLFLQGNKGRPGLGESAMPRPSIGKRPSNSKKRQLELDYDDGTLATMNYADLKNEAFDHDPAQEEAQSVMGPPRGTLPEKLDYFLDQDQPTQLEFFSKMPVGDWETSGDWFLERFGDIMKHLREARQAKRAMIRGFEEEIADRGDAVRSKIEGIDTTLSEFKKEGEVMMLGKEFD
ncbi:hypothetical protein M426DRAFT_317296 [Hypoxylon sp. CI-4A]|nr:hypothetical protein M426DRAFT_317296 [Hypoxylon sp. CI-4A]